MLIESIKNAVKNLNKFEVSGIKAEDKQVLVFVAKQSLIYALEQTNDYLKHLEEKHNASNIQE
jgi:vacuolar-type H+-ATPase subunit E/Vma4